MRTYRFEFLYRLQGFFSYRPDVGCWHRSYIWFPYRPDIGCRYRSTIGCATRLQIGPISAQCINMQFCRHYTNILIWVFISVTGLIFISARCRVPTSVLHLNSISARYRMPMSVLHRMCNSATDRADIGSVYKYAVMPTLCRHTDLSFISVPGLVFISAQHRSLTSVQHRMCNSATDRSDVGYKHEIDIVPTWCRLTSILLIED